MPLKQINHLTQLAQASAPGLDVTAITTANPSTPTKFSTCITPQYPMITRHRVAQQVPHGRKVWVPGVNDGLAPTICDSNHAIWIGNNPCPADEPCNFFIAEPQEVPPAVNWNSLIHKCAGENPPDAICVSKDVTYGAGPNFNWGPIIVTPTVVQFPLGEDIDSVLLPATGSFSVASGTQWAIDPGGPQPTYGIRDLATGLNLSGDAPYAPDSRPCSGNLAMVPRRPITAAGGRIAHGFSTGPGVGNCFAVPSNILLVMWWA